jgi:predicted TIM-barrel fold metal-dependent hydrolase
MKIDAHIHLYDPSDRDYGWPPQDWKIYRRVGPDDFRSVAEPLGVTRSVVVACSTDPGQLEFVLQTHHDDPSVAAVIGASAPNNPDFIAQYDRFSAYSKFRGFRFHCMEASGEQAARNVAHLAGKPANVMEFLGDVDGIGAMRGLVAANPDVTFVIEHFARVRTDAETVSRDFAQLLDDMAGFAHVCIKTSALLPLAAATPTPTAPASYAPVLQAAWQAFGEDRCLFGSDWPLLEMKGEYATAVRATEAFFAAKSPDAIDKVMRRNAVRVYKLKGEESA